MKKAIISIVSIILIGVGVYINQPKPTVSGAKPVIKIGAVLPLTGNMADTRNASLKAMITAIEDENSNHDNKFLYELIVEDYGFKTQHVFAITNKLLSSDKVKAIINLYSVAGKVIAPLAASEKIIHIDLSYSKEVLRSKYNFQGYVDANDVAKAIATFSAKNNFKTISLIVQNIAAGDETLGFLEPKLQEKGII